MTNSIGSPPPKNPNLPETSMPPPTNPQPSNPTQLPPPPLSQRDSNNSDDSSAQTSKLSSQGVVVPYKIPLWSGAPSHELYLEVLKDGAIIDKFNVFEKWAYMFGRLDLCDFVLEHPTISRFHAVIQFKRTGDAYFYDLGSTHGNFLNKNQDDADEITWQTYKEQLTEK